MASRDIFYTVNGKYQGIAFSDVQVTSQEQKERRNVRCKSVSTLYAAVCLQSTGEEITVNFQGGDSGEETNFVFDLNAFQMENLHTEYTREIGRRQPMAATVCKELVIAYLQRYAYIETLQAVQGEVPDQQSSELFRRFSAEQLDEECKTSVPKLGRKMTLDEG
jgi:hypothetical protein